MRRELFVGNLDFSITDETLREIFSEAGSIESAKVIMDRMSGRSRGFGFVTMQTVEEATAAIEKLNNREIQGRALRINFSNSDDDRAPRSRSSGGYGGSSGGGHGHGGSGGGSFQRKPFGSRN